MTRNLKTKLIFTAVYLLLAAVLYLSGIGCIFRYFLNITCPGCGMTRALLAALRFDFSVARHFHPLFWSVPILYLYFLFEEKLFKNRVFNIVLFSIIGTGFAANWIYSLFSNALH